MTSNDALQGELEKLCECAICFDRVTNPRTLPCDHSFCKDCLEELVKFKQRNIPYVQCPSRCGEQYLPPGSSISKMKASLYLKQLLDLLEKNDPIVNNSYSIVTRSCIVKTCLRKPNVYCVTCKHFLCNQCSKRGSESCRDKHEVKQVCYSKRRDTFEPYCSKHECSATFYCQSCSAQYICKYCKQYNHFDHRVTELTFEQVYKPYKNQEQTIESYNELLEDLNRAITAIWQNVEETEESFSRYLEKRKTESILQFLDQLIAAENSIRQQYQSKVQHFLEDILDRKSKFDELIKKNEQYHNLLDHLEGRTLVELLYDNRVSTIDNLIQENQSTYNNYSQLDDFKIFVSPNKDLDLERPFGHVNFSKDVLTDKDIIKRLHVLNPISESKKNKEDKEREKQYEMLKEKLQLLFSSIKMPLLLSVDGKMATTRRNSYSHIEDPKKKNTHHPLLQRSLSCEAESSNERLVSRQKLLQNLDENKHFRQRLNVLYKTEEEKPENNEVPPDLPEREPIKIPSHPPPTALRKASTSEHPHLCILAEETMKQMKAGITKGNIKCPLVLPNVGNLARAIGDQIQKKECDLENIPEKKESLPQRKVHQKRRPRVLPKPDRTKNLHSCRGRKDDDKNNNNLPQQ